MPLIASRNVRIVHQQRCFVCFLACFRRFANTSECLRRIIIPLGNPIIPGVHAIQLYPRAQTRNLLGRECLNAGDLEIVKSGRLESWIMDIQRCGESEVCKFVQQDELFSLYINIHANFAFAGKARPTM